MRLPSLRRRAARPKQLRPLPFTEAQIAERAYQLWQADPEGSAESHWEKAIQALKRERSPLWKVRRLLGLAFTAETPAAALDVVKVVVSTLGLLATVTAGISLYLNYQQGQERLVTDRFAKAVEQLGSKEPDVRIGAVYSLERIARDSPKDQGTIMEVLTAFIRNKARLPEDKKQKLKPVETDVQSALTVLGRRDTKNDPKGIWTEQQGANRPYSNSEALGLQSTNLYRANLYRATFSRATFSRANLGEAYLSGAILKYVFLDKANLRNANLRNANLYRARLIDTELTGADLLGANLEGALIIRAVGVKPEQIQGAYNWEKAHYDPDFRQKLELSPAKPKP